MILFSHDKLARPNCKLYVVAAKAAEGFIYMGI